MGLTDEEVKENRSKYGTNEISRINNNSFLRLLLESLGDPIIKILLIALAIKVIFLFKDFDWYETIGILIAIFLASFISTISEYGSNKAFEKIQQESLMLKTKVFRNNILKEIYIKEIVKNDLVKLSSGDKVPADGIIIKGCLSLDESFLTGETKEVNKTINNEVFFGSTIYKGDAIIRVTNIGDNSYMGTVSKSLQEKDEKSPLKSKLTVLAKSISKLGYIGAILASVSYLFIEIVVKNDFDINLIINTITNYKLMFNYFLYALTLSVTIIIMAVPEGLPMMITLVLSSNMKKMIKDNVLVRKMVGIETSGSLNVLLCDKTGTLTTGDLKVKYLTTYDREYDSLTLIKDNINYDRIKKSLILNNEVIKSNDSLIGGNITDKAILKYMENENCNDEVLERKEFDSNNKYSYVKTKDYYFYKGASETLLDKISNYLNQDGKIMNINKDCIKDKINKYTEEGYRVLINAYSEKYFSNLIFLNLIVISDHIRNESYDAIEKIQNAGIDVVMITGDAKKTAYKIAKDLNIIKNDSIVITHDELVKLSKEELIYKLPRIKVIARALPEDKKLLVDIYKSLNIVVGMTGDGINDAMALKKSDVGFAMGSGAEVAKEASDIVILDNNILSIYKAILYGRTIFKSIRKFVTYQLTVNICALLLSIVGTLIGVSSPITIVQMLWLNMIMDTFAGLAFSYERPLKEYMKEYPKKRDEKIMNYYMKNEIIVNGLYSSLLCILFLKVPFIKDFYRYSYDNRYLMTAFFALFIFLGIINSFLARSNRLNFLSGIFKNKVFLIINIFIFIVQIWIIYYGGDLFRTYGLTLREILITILLSFTIIPVDLIRKLILKKKKISLGF